MRKFTFVSENGKRVIISANTFLQAQRQLKEMATESKSLSTLQFKG